ncbi:MAG: GTP 3',8-cyclase MoaA [Thiohalospira sp.]|uniref:GTP 3',8-cyclase MoaA n=1 Tax=Thiohalospira sp. TaxID=3080549 RepID=UPI00397FDBB2
MQQPALIDPFGRRIEYLRVSVTDRCDLRCNYCMPRGFRDFEVPEDWLTTAELERIVAAFARLGTRRVRLTGGEPLVRRELPDMARAIAALPGIRDLSLSTNATRLRRHAEELREAGVDRLNVSLDTLDPERFKAITGGRLDKVLDGLEAARDAGLGPVKINTVVQRGTNDDELDALVDYCIERGFTLRFIETMPVGETGREATEGYVDLAEVRRGLEQRFELLPAAMPGGGPARYVQVAGTDVKIGFITPLSQHFCDTCNRVRLAVDGTLHLCLGDEATWDLRTPVREGASDAELEEQIRAAIAIKPERHEFNDRPEKVVRFMSMTGG